MYKKYGKIGSSNVIVSGHPTLDYILTPQPDTVQKDERYKKTIIWAPHWTVDSKFKKEFLSTGTFNKNYLFFLNLFKKYPDIKWVVKPHPLLKTQMTKILKAISSKEWEEYFKTLQSLPNVDIVEGHYIKYFINSDLLITDSLSFLTIYFFTGKPVILIKKDNKEPKELYNNYALEITETYYYANTESEIIASINKIIKGEDILLERRKKLLEKKLSEMKYNLGYNAGEFIARHIEDYFKRNEKEKL
jgi:CDP-glycerol glycerophosphotransferase (TagB/SpsB family)